MGVHQEISILSLCSLESVLLNLLCVFPSVFPDAAFLQCVCVCVCVCMRVHMHACLRTCMRVCVCVCLILIPAQYMYRQVLVLKSMMCQKTQPCGW